MSTAPHVQRMIDEHAALSAKVTALEQFIDQGAIFSTLPSIDQKLMWEQLAFMRAYMTTLNARISRVIS